jgi:hypothetical protein
MTGTAQPSRVLKKGMMIRLYKKAAAPSALILDHKK